MDRFQQRLTKTNSKTSVNEEVGMPINLDSKVKVLPLTDVNRTLNVNDQFNKERQSSFVYRLIATTTALFNNVLFDLTTWGTLNNLRDESLPPNGILPVDSSGDSFDIQDITFEESIDKNINLRDGWYGNLNTINLTNDKGNIFTQFSPQANTFSFIPKNTSGVLSDNWKIKITYPSSIDDSHYVVINGLIIVDKFLSVVGGKNMLGLITPVKHGLSQGEYVDITGLNAGYTNKTYRVVKTGDNLGDLSEYAFVIDVEKTPSSNIGTDSVITTQTRMRRVVSGEFSKYYFRRFEAITDLDDYELYPLAFAKGFYNDKKSQIAFNQDIDVGNLTDNLGRPLSELYYTFVKTDSDGVFTKVKSGLDVPFLETLNVSTPSSPNNAFTAIGDINRIHNGGSTPVVSHNPLDTDVTTSQNIFYGDVAEYNRYEVTEHILGEVKHRFNSINREASSSILIKDRVSGGIPTKVTTTSLLLGPRYEGYTYKPHHLIKIRNFSNFIEQGDSSTIGIPSYAEDLGDGRYLWRDFMDIGYNDGQGLLDYPFLNGSHYIHNNICINGRRQDPFNKYNLYYNTFPRDIYGEEADNGDFKTNNGGDDC